MELTDFLFPLSLFIFITLVFHSQNPVYGVLSFVAVVLHVAVLLIVLDLEFLAYVLGIVYIGAIVVLFLFVNFGLANICPHQAHVICNPEIDDHRCTCGVAAIADVSIFRFLCLSTCLLKIVNFKKL